MQSFNQKLVNCTKTKLLTKQEEEEKANYVKKN